MRIPVVIESGQEVVKGGLASFCENDVFAGEAVFGAIVRDAPLAFRRLRAGDFFAFRRLTWSCSWDAITPLTVAGAANGAAWLEARDD